MSPSPIVRVGADEVLTVTADAGSYGTVWTEDGRSQWTVSAKSPLRLAAGVYRVETVRGTVSHAVTNKDAAALQEKLPALTNITYAQRVIQTAINKEISMSTTALREKAMALADKAKSVPAALHSRLDVSLSGLVGAERDGNAAIDAIDTVVADVKASTEVVKDVANQLTNGAPPLQPS